MSCLDLDTHSVLRGLYAPSLILVAFSSPPTILLLTLSPVVLASVKFVLLLLRPYLTPPHPGSYEASTCINTYYQCQCNEESSSARVFFPISLCDLKLPTSVPPSCTSRVVDLNCPPPLQTSYGVRSARTLPLKPCVRVLTSSYCPSSLGSLSILLGPSLMPR
jgi:hypothetical protein